MNLTPTDRDLFFSRQDPEDPRLGDFAQGLSALSAPEDLGRILSANPGRDMVVVIGYPDDEGIRINGGRAGAAHGPKSIRRPLYKMTPPLDRGSRPMILDAGDLVPSGRDLGARHALGSAFATTALKNGARWLALGGGHDYGFSEADAFCSWAIAHGERPLVINFDAHLDVRPPSKGLSSGTPFYRMMDKHHSLGLDFVEIGIQPQCNSQAHAKWLTDRGGRILSLEQWTTSGEALDVFVTREIGDLLLKKRPALISVDIDAFSSSIAPGCSQSWATGFEAREFLPVFDLLLRRLDVRALGVYEVSPPLDHDDRTSKWAAQIAHRFLFNGLSGALS